MSDFADAVEAERMLRAAAASAGAATAGDTVQADGESVKQMFGSASGGMGSGGAGGTAAGKLFGMFPLDENGSTPFGCGGLKFGTVPPPEVVREVKVSFVGFGDMEVEFDEIVIKGVKARRREAFAPLPLAPGGPAAQVPLTMPYETNPRF
ncbi:MAG: hypothetical protein IT371_30490 [Deltaproteobacteria bacterium]|nr:hypothetical protein [Deltaproteobacteria bacterium]